MKCPIAMPSAVSLPENTEISAEYRPATLSEAAERVHCKAGCLIAPISGMVWEAKRTEDDGAT